MRFEGTADYVATPDLTVAVNAAITLERPLLVKGEPGTGKTELARQVAASLRLPLIEWHVKSTTRAALTRFFEIRETPGLKKKPSTSEVLDWIRLLLAEDLAPEDLRQDPLNLLPRLHGALLKNEQDVHLFERLAFMARARRS